MEEREEGVVLESRLVRRFGRREKADVVGADEMRERVLEDDAEAIGWVRRRDDRRDADSMDQDTVRGMAVGTPFDRLGSASNARVKAAT